MDQNIVNGLHMLRAGFEKAGIDCTTTVIEIPKVDFDKLRAALKVGNAPDADLVQFDYDGFTFKPA